MKRELGSMIIDDDTHWLRWVTRQFEMIAGEDKEINMKEFRSALKVKESFFAERFFALFDCDGSGSISLDELFKALDLLIHGTETEKLQFLFQVYDVDGSGSIDPDELKTVLKSCLSESAISLPEEKLNDLTLVLFESADEDQSGSITFEELKAQLENFPEVMENLTISAANWLKPPNLDKRSSQSHRYFTRAYWQNNSRKLLFLCTYILVNLLLFIVALWQHSSRGCWLMVARGCGLCLNFNCTFIVVLMLRRCLTWLRATWMVRVLPLDQNIFFHQMVGYAILNFSLLHMAAHVLNFAIMSQHSEFLLWEYLLTVRPGIGWVGGAAALTGLILQLLICLMVLGSSTFVRRSGHFEVFYWSHLSYLCVWFLLIIHCANFWKWFTIPGLVFLLEKAVGIAVSHMGSLYIVEVNLLPSKVTHLVIKRPQFFHFRPGDYIYINIPVIAKYEWHPFTISSAPEQTDTLWLHVRSLGQWTNRLYEFFRESQSQTIHSQRPASGFWRSRHQPKAQRFKFEHVNQVVASTADCSIELTRFQQNNFSSAEYESVLLQYKQGDKCFHDELRPTDRSERPQEHQTHARFTDVHKLCNIRCFVDGPFGTSTRQIFDSEHAVLIGAGIGITPFASILQSIMYRYRSRKKMCPNSNISSENLKNDMKLRKVDFIWINRDQKSFEWFVSLLTKLEMEQADTEPEGRFLEMHMYMTAALSKNDMKAIGLQMALDLLAQKEKKDSITGLRTRTQPGRPQWHKVFQKLSEENKGKVHVFYCGAPSLAKVIKAQCELFGFKFYKENF